MIAATSPNTGLPTSLRFIQIAYGDFGNPENEIQHKEEEYETKKS
jgi:hypothetical protein